MSQLMLPYEQKKLNLLNSVSIGTVCGVNSYNKCSKCSLLALTQNNVCDLEELDSSGTLATTGPAMIIRSVIRIRH